MKENWLIGFKIVLLTVGHKIDFKAIILEKKPSNTRTILDHIFFPCRILTLNTQRVPAQHLRHPHRLSAPGRSSSQQLKPHL